MPLNEKQARFVEELLLDMSPADAYLRAGYRVASREVAWKASSRLLKNVEVLRAIDEAQAGRIDRLRLDGDWVVGRFEMVYLQAMRDRDCSAAIKALENIGKYLGLFEKHNRQKTYTREEIDRMKADLEKMGVDWRRKGLIGEPGHDERGFPLSPSEN